MTSLLNKVFQHRSALNWIALSLSTCMISLACSKAPSNTSTFSEDGCPSQNTVASEDVYPPFDLQENGKHVGYNQDWA